MPDILDRFYDFGIDQNAITLEQATFIKENAAAKIKIVIQFINIDKSGGATHYVGEVFAFVRIK